MIKNGLCLLLGGKSLLAAWYLGAAFLLLTFSAEWAAAQPGTGDESAPPPVRCLVFSPDGRLLAAAGADDTDRGELVVWKVGSWQPQWRHREPVGFPRAVFSPDGKVLALSRFAPETKLFDAASGELLSELQGHTNHARCVTFTPDGERIITGSYDRTIKIWNALPFRRTESCWSAATETATSRSGVWRTGKKS